MAKVELIEIWKDIPHYKGIYQVSNLGNVRSVDRFVICRNGKILKRKGGKIRPSLNRDGYYQVCLRKKCKGITYRVSCLVASSFIGERIDGMEVDHINGCRSDDRLENLRWVTHKENCNNPHFIRKQHERGMANNMPTMKRIAQIDTKGNIVKVWNSLGNACRNLNMDASTVSKVCRDMRRMAYGYKWAYI